MVGNQALFIKRGSISPNLIERKVSVAEENTETTAADDVKFIRKFQLLVAKSQTNEEKQFSRKLRIIVAIIATLFVLVSGCFAAILLAM